MRFFFLLHLDFFFGGVGFYPLWFFLLVAYMMLRCFKFIESLWEVKLDIIRLCRYGFICILFTSFISYLSVHVYLLELLLPLV